MSTAVSRISVGRIAVMGLLFVGATACGSGTPTAEDPHTAELRAIRDSYDSYFRTNRPDYVMITYPKTVLALSAHDQKVFQIITGCLKDQAVPYQCLTLDDALETVSTSRLKREYLAYRIPENVIQTVAGGTLMYVNLEAPEDLHTRRHPVAVEHDINVRVWCDRSAGQSVL